MSSSDGSHPQYRSDEKRKNDQLKIIARLRERIPNEAGAGCFLCKWIVEDFEKTGRLTDFPFDANDKGMFPIRGKIDHMRLELMGISFS